MTKLWIQKLNMTSPFFSSRYLAIQNAVGLLAVLYVNVLASTASINGVTTGQLAEEYPNLFAPAGFTFAIWGVVYLLLLGFSVYSVALVFSRKVMEADRMNFLAAIGPWFLISCLANIFWVIAWHNRLVTLSVILMVILLVSLIAIYQRLYIGRIIRPIEKILVHLPFSVYLGWISIATMANVTVWFVHRGWTGDTDVQVKWAATLVVLAAGLGLYMLKYCRDLGFGLVILWALIGIGVKRASVDPDPWNLVSITAALGITAILIRLFAAILNRPAI